MIVDRQLFETGADAAKLLEPADALFDDCAASVCVAIKSDARVVPRPFIVLVRNDRLNPAATQPGAHPLDAVSLVAGEFPGPVSSPALLAPPSNAACYGLPDDRLGPRRFVDLTRRNLDGERSSRAVSNHMEFRSKPASAAAQRVVRRFVGMAVETFLSAPAAARAARTLAPSTHQSSQSMKPRSSSLICSASMMAAKTPAFRHREQYRWTVLQEPNRSGRSRQAAPVPRIQRMPLSINRGSFGGRPVRAAFRGTNGATSSHCSSVSSCRFMFADLHGVMEDYRQKFEF